MYQQIDEPTTSTERLIQSQGCCFPSGRFYRYYVLIAICGMGFGSYFAYDSPAALEDEITREMGVTTASFAALYSWYSWPNVILCFFGGFLIDQTFGIRWGAIIYSSIVLIGQLIVAFGAFIDVFPVMNLGRFVFGIGGESLAVAQNTYAVSWFAGKELNFVFGLQLSLSRVGSTVGLNLIKPIYHALGSLAHGHTLLGLVLFASASTCAFSLISAIIAAILDRRARPPPDNKTSKTEDSESQIVSSSQSESGIEPPPEVISFSDIKTFGSSFWYLSLICVLFYNCIFPFVSLGTVFFKRKFSLPDAEANGVDSIVYTISAIASPIFGYLIDMTGRNLTWVAVSTVLALVSHMTLAFTFINPWFPMILMGISYCILACALWPMVSYIIPEQQLGTAYGIMQSIQNLGLAVTPLVAGYLVDWKGYITLEVFFLANMCACALFVVLLFISDHSRDGLLNMHPSTRAKYMDDMEKKRKAEKEKESKRPSTSSTATQT